MASHEDDLPEFYNWAVRLRRKLRMRIGRATPPRSGATLAESCDPYVSTVEVSLLGCFGRDQLAERSHKALRAALLDSGLPGAAVGHLIRRSPLLERASRGKYRLRPFSDQGGD